MKSKSTDTLNIILDSSIYRKDNSFATSNLQLIKELGKLDLVTIHIPWFIYMECTSGFTNILEKEIDSSIKGINTINEHGRIFKGFPKIVAAHNELLRAKEQVPYAVENLWHDYIKTSKAILTQFDASESKTVFANYFIGKTPFSSIKNRSDIPDAFIYESILKLSKFKIVHFMTEDIHFGRELSKVNNVIVHKDLNEFYKSDYYKPIAKEYNARVSYSKAKSELLSKEKEIIQECIDYLKIYLLPQPFEDAYLMSDGNNGFVNDVEEITSIKMQHENIKFINKIFFIPIVVNAFCNVEYMTLKKDSMRISSRRSINVREWSDTYDTITERMPLILKFEVEVYAQEDDGSFDFLMSNFTDVKVDGNKYLNYV